MQIHKLKMGHKVTGLAVFLVFMLSSEGVLSQEVKDCGSGFKQGAEQFVQVQYRSKNRKGVAKQVVTEAEVLWQPQEMLSDVSCYDLKQTTLLYKPVSSDVWLEATDRQRSAGKYTKWIVDGIKPCLEYQFQIKVEGSEPEVSEAMFELPTTLGPASEEDIIESGFKPETPTNFGAKVGANSATITWSESDCALTYEIGLAESGDASKLRSESVPAGGETKVNIGDLKPCTRYEATISALLGDEYSEDLISSFATKPRLDAVSSLKPTFVTALDSAVVTWDTWQSVSCIDQYQVTLCHKLNKKCEIPVIVTKAQGMPTVSYTAKNLDPCTAYTFEIKPLYPDTKIDEKVYEFKTQSPPADTLSVERVSAKSLSTSTMQVSWTQVKCAVNYRVYQKATEDNSWNQVADTPQLEIPVDNITPCTRYHFAISAILDNGEETKKSVGPEMISDLEEREPFEAPNLFVLNADRHADVSWGHADCISSYLVKVCQVAYTDCLEAAVNPTDYIDGAEKDRTIRYKITNLDPCTLYTLEIIPVIPGKAFTARPQEFTTTNGTPQPPEDLKVSLVGHKSELSWNPVQCSTGYKIYQRIGDPESGSESSAEMTHSLKGEYDNLVPCEAYFYAVSTLVAEQESVKTNWFSVSVQPYMNEAPELKILNNENDNITLRLDPSASNEKCNIDEYELSYSSDGGMRYTTKTMLAADIPTADIVLSFTGATTPLSIVRGRVKYEGMKEWSPVVSTHEPGDHSAIKGLDSGGSGDGATLVPIVVGCLVAIAIVAVVAFFVVRRRRNRSLYDAEKADANGKLNGNGTTDETQKLNTESTHQDV